MQNWLYREIAVHFVLFFVCLYREMFETVLGWKAKLAIFLECGCIMSYFLVMIEGLENIAIFKYWHHQKNTYLSDSNEFR